MPISVLFARFFAVYFFIIALAVFSLKDFLFRAIEDVFATPGIMLTTCIMNIMFGLGILIVHPYWSFEWNLVITLIGLLSLLFGIGRLFKPDFIRNFLLRIWNGPGYRILGSILAILAVYFVFFGFVH